MRANALVLLAVAIPSAGTTTAPQAPLASGSPASIRIAIKAAHRCGITKVRTQPASGGGGKVSLYSNIDPPDYLKAYKCVEEWVSANSKRLRLTAD